LTFRINIVFLKVIKESCNFPSGLLEAFHISICRHYFEIYLGMFMRPTCVLLLKKKGSVYAGGGSEGIPPSFHTSCDFVLKHGANCFAVLGIYHRLQLP